MAWLVPVGWCGAACAPSTTRADGAPCAIGAAPGHSPELEAALQSGLIPDCAQDELVLRQEFDRPDRSRHWRGGLVKSSFNYLLLDPR